MLTMLQVCKEEFNREGVIEDAVEAIKYAQRRARNAPSNKDTLAAAHAVTIAAAAFIAAMVLMQQHGSEEICQGNQWRCARAGVVEVRDHDCAFDRLIGSLCWSGRGAWLHFLCY